MVIEARRGSTVARGYGIVALTSCSHPATPHLFAALIDALSWQPAPGLTATIMDSLSARLLKGCVCVYPPACIHSPPTPHPCAGSGRLGGQVRAAQTDVRQVQKCAGRPTPRPQAGALRRHMCNAAAGGCHHGSVSPAYA